MIGGAMISRFTGAQWQPNSERQPLLWLKADVGVTTSSGQVTAWADQSGHGFTCSPRNSSIRPTYSATQWNGSQPGVKFGSAYSEVFSSAAGLADLGTGFRVRVYAVWDVASHASVQKLMQWYSGGGGYGAYEIQISAAHLDEFSYSSGGVLIDGSAISGKHVTEHCMNRTADNLSNSKIDGVVSIASAAGVSTAATDAFAIGGNALIGNGALDATVAEIVIYNCAVTDYEVEAKFRAYAKARWSGLP